MRDVERELDDPKTQAADGIAQRAITPAVALVREDSERHEIYLRGHARLARRTRVAAEGGWTWAPRVGSPSEPERGPYVEGRLSHGLTAPLPATLSVFGHFRNGASEGEYVVTSSFPGDSESKDWERRTLDWGFSLTALPRRGTSVYLSVTRQKDRQRFPHVRSNVPRPNGADFVRFFRDAELGWETDARILAIGATQRVTRAIDFSIGGWLGYVDGSFDENSATAAAIDPPNRIDLAFGSAEAALGAQVHRALRLGLAYRFDAYRDDARLDEPRRDGHDHAVTLSVTYDFAFESTPK
jgi:hypothetical protein